MGPNHQAYPTYRTVALALFAALIVGLVGCDRPVVAEAGTPASDGGIEFSIGDFDVRYLELSDGDDTYEYPRPVLVIPVTLKNVGESDYVYNPTHATQQMTEAATPLLYLDPGPEADLPPESKSPINGVFLQKGQLAEQVTQNRTLKPGDALTDLFLFEVPDEGVSNLILSLPPSMHRGKMPVLFRFAYTPREPKGPKIHDVGDALAFGGVEFKVTGAEYTYVKTSDANLGDGYSSEPLFKVSYEIENKSDGTITYEPSHRDMGGRGAGLFGKDRTYKRVKFAVSTSIEGQQRGSKEIEPGAKVSDFVLFETPAEGVEQVTFEYPASLFDKSGIARINIAVEHKEPPLPAELKKAEKKSDPPKSEDG